MKHSFKQASNYHKNARIQRACAFILAQIASGIKIDIKDVEIFGDFGVLDSKLDFKTIDCIIDIGAGSGNMAYAINEILARQSANLGHFIAIDSESHLLDSHPKILSQMRHIQCNILDFNNGLDLNAKNAVIFSNAALHWAKDLDFVLKNLAKLGAKKYFFSIFLDDSLLDLHAFCGSKSPLRSRECVEKLLDKYFLGRYFILHLKEHFNSPDSALLSLKSCGLLGGGAISFSAKKNLAKHFPHKILDYEVLFFSAIARDSF